MTKLQAIVEAPLSTEKIFGHTRGSSSDLRR